MLTTLQSTLVVGQAFASAGGGTVSQALGPAAGFGITIALLLGLVVLGLVHLVVSRRDAVAGSAG